MRNRKPILLVEDDQVDAMIIKRAMNNIKISNYLIIRENGEEAMEYLNDITNEQPAIILLDLNMPKMNGFEFLEAAKSDDAIKNIPVIILTTSNEKFDRIRSFRLGAAGYIVKSVDYRQFVEDIRIIDHYWTLSELPG